MPWLSIIIPVFNHTSNLAALLQSITHRAGVDVIVVDDGSDCAARIQLEMTCLNNGADVVRSPRNLGIARARNLGASVASGGYLLFVDSDDLMSPFSLPTFQNCIQRFPSSDVIYGDVGIISSLGETIELDRLERPMSCATVADRLELLWGGLAQVGAMCVRRETFLKIGGMRDGLKGWDDRDLQYRLVLSAARCVF